MNETKTCPDLYIFFPAILSEYDFYWLAKWLYNATTLSIIYSKAKTKSKDEFNIFNNKYRLYIYIYTTVYILYDTIYDDMIWHAWYDVFISFRIGNVQIYMNNL